MNWLNSLTHAYTPTQEQAAQLSALKRTAMLVRREALTLTYNDVLLLMALVFLLALPFTLLLKKPAPSAAAAEAH
jgi:DHA2 family multidrug resistance protein